MGEYIIKLPFISYITMKREQHCCTNCRLREEDEAVLARSFNEGKLIRVYHQILNFGGCLRFKHSLVKFWSQMLHHWLQTRLSSALQLSATVKHCLRINCYTIYFIVLDITTIIISSQLVVI